MRAFLVLLLLACAAAPTSLNGQQSRGPAAPTGTGRISGAVVDAKAQPVRGAVVRLTGAELPLGRATITDENGKFLFDALPAGRFSVTSSKPAYLQSAYGAVRPGGTGTPITLAAGEQKSDVSITMPRGSAITGVVREQDGAPIPAIQVYAVRTNATALPANRLDAANTDDRGVYRIFGLAPGSYYVMVERASSGGIGGVGLMSSAEIDATLARLQARVPGVTPPSKERAPSSIVRPTRTLDPAPVFHPGVASTASAGVISLGTSEERAGVDVVYQLIPSVSVSGSVGGAAAGQTVSLSLLPEGGTSVGRALFAGPMLQRRTSTGDGDFTFTGVTPGSYTLLAVSAVSNSNGIPTSTAGSRYATAAVEVLGDDIGGVSLSLTPTLRANGRIVFPGGTAPAGQALTNLFVTLTPPITAGTVAGSATGRGVAADFFTRPSGFVRDDGSFEITGVVSGKYRLTTSRNPAGWTPKTAMLGGQDILDQIVEISGDVAGIELTMTNQPSQLSGRMLKADNTPAPGYFVIAFTADRSLWQPNSRRLRSVRPGTDGSFRFEDLPPGEYYLAALTEADSDDWQSASFLAEVVPAAIKLTVADGEKKVQDLKVGR